MARVLLGHGIFGHNCCLDTVFFLALWDVGTAGWNPQQVLYRVSGVVVFFHCVTCDSIFCF